MTPNASPRTRDVILIEEPNTDTDLKFLHKVAKPYFRSIFKDISERNKAPNKQVNRIDKTMFYEFTKLPGIINDRFFSLF